MSRRSEADCQDFLKDVLKAAYLIEGQLDFMKFMTRGVYRGGTIRQDIASLSEGLARLRMNIERRSSRVDLLDDPNCR
jgi:hypothetical protein